MPLFEYRCANKHDTLKVLRVKDYEEAVDCEQCDLAAVRVFTAPVVKVAVDVHYTSPIDKRPITTHAARREDMKRNGCIEYDPEMHRDVERRKQEEDAAFDASIDDTVHREVAKLPKAKKDQLVKEVTRQGMTVEAVRA